MKIKPIMNSNNFYNSVKNNLNTKGTHLFISSGQINEEKKDYSNVVLLSLMDEKDFLKKSFDETINTAQTFVDNYEKDKNMGL